MKGQPESEQVKWSALDAFAKTDLKKGYTGQVLVGLLKRIDREARGHSVIDAASLDATVGVLAG